MHFEVRHKTPRITFVTFSIFQLLFFFWCVRTSTSIEHETITAACCCTEQHVRHYLLIPSASPPRGDTSTVLLQRKNLHNTKTRLIMMHLLPFYIWRVNYDSLLFFTVYRKLYHHSHCCCGTEQCNTGDTASTDWQYCRVRSYCQYHWQYAVCHRSIGPILRESEYTRRLCSCVPPELRIEWFGARNCRCTVDTRSNLGGYCHDIACPGQLMS